MKCLLLVALLMPGTVYAEDYLVTGGRSLDGQYELKIQGKNEDSQGYQYFLYDCKDRKTHPDLQVGGGWCTFAGARGSAKAVWNSRSSLVVLSDRVAKSGNALFLFEIVDGGLKQLQMPDYMENLLGRVGAITVDRHCFSEPKRWLSTQITSHYWIDDLYLDQYFDTDKPGEARSDHSFEVVLSVSTQPNVETCARLKAVSNTDNDEKR